MLSDRSKLFAKQSLIEAFEYLDSDKNGFLEKEELRLVLKGGNF
jgi:Ca2+-binding EF-hand superfamily protein